MQIRLKRVYEDADPSDGYRVLVDRLWPRGVSKERAKIDLWDKDITPSNHLRKWFGHSPDRWPLFEEEYIKELEDDPTSVNKFLKELKGHNNVTFVYGAKDTAHTHALVLQKYIQDTLH